VTSRSPPSRGNHPRPQESDHLSVDRHPLWARAQAVPRPGMSSSTHGTYWRVASPTAGRPSQPAQMLLVRARTTPCLSRPQSRTDPPNGTGLANRQKQVNPPTVLPPEAAKVPAPWNRRDGAVGSQRRRRLLSALWEDAARERIGEGSSTPPWARLCGVGLDQALLQAVCPPAGTGKQCVPLLRRPFSATSDHEHQQIEPFRSVG
jgi:hypothetical protein